VKLLDLLRGEVTDIASGQSSTASPFSHVAVLCVFHLKVILLNKFK
jgi:hypothetical protein